MGSRPLGTAALPPRRPTRGPASAEASDPSPSRSPAPPRGRSGTSPMPPTPESSSSVSPRSADVVPASGGMPRVELRRVPARPSTPSSPTMNRTPPTPVPRGPTTTSSPQVAPRPSTSNIHPSNTPSSPSLRKQSSGSNLKGGGGGGGGGGMTPTLVAGGSSSSGNLMMHPTTPTSSSSLPGSGNGSPRSVGGGGGSHRTTAATVSRPIEPYESLRGLKHGVQARKEIELYFSVVSSVLGCLELTPEAVREVEKVLGDRIADARQPRNDLSQPSTILLSAEKRRTLQNLTNAVHQFLHNQRLLGGVVLLQASARRFLARRAYVTQLRAHYGSGLPLRVRAQAVRDLWRREKEYLGSLHVLVHEYLASLEAAKLLSEKEAKAVFSNVRDLLTLHEELYKQLTKVVDRWPAVDGVAEVFLTMAPFFRAYGTYFSNVTTSTMTLQSLVIKDRKVAALLEEVFDRAEKRHSVYVDIHGLLHAPLNQIAAYEGAMLTVLEHTPTDHPEYKSTAHCLAILSQTSRACSKALELSENSNQMKRIAELVKDDSLLSSGASTSANTRMFITEADCLLVDTTGAGPASSSGAKGKSLAEKGHFFLFSDVVLLCAPLKAGHHKERDRMLLAETDAVRGTGDDAHVILLSSHRSPSSSNSAGKAASRALQFASADEAAAFFKHFETSILNFKGSKVFGNSLEKLASLLSNAPSSAASPIPPCVAKMATLLEPFMHVEGLFRVSGVSSMVEFLVNECDRAGALSVPDVNWSHLSPHDLSTTFKRFFGDLAEPLFTYDLYDDFLRLGAEQEKGLRASPPAPDALEALLALLRKLPLAHILALKFLLPFIAQIERASAVNKMTAPNLAIVFAPNLFKPREVSMSYTSQIAISTTLMEVLIRHSSLLMNTL